MIDKKYIENIINQEIIDKYSVGILNNINEFPENIKGYLKFAILRFDLNKDLGMIKRKLLDPIKKNKIDMRSKKAIIELINSYLGISEVERKTFGEVSTPIYDKPGCVNEQLSLLDKDFWTNPYCKILDCAVGIGNYPTVLLDKFMSGLKGYKDDKIDLTDSKIRYKWIMENIIYVVDINPKNLWIYYNIFDEKNELKMNYYLGSFLEPEFDTHMKEVWKIDNWDLVCTNPPYMNNMGKGSKPLYNHFIEKSLKISNKIIMITPSRWFSGGKGLDKFRKMMLDRNDIKIIKHFDENINVFDGTDIDGGVSYFLIDNEYSGLVKFNNELIDTKKSDVLITDTLSNDIIEKINIKECDNFSSYVLSRKPFGLESNHSKWSDNGIPTLTRSGIKNAKKDCVNDKFNILDKYKIVISKADGNAFKTKKILNKYYILTPGQASVETYLICYTSDNEDEVKNAGEYLLTKFSRYLLFVRMSNKNLSKDKFKFIPKVDFSRSWTDEELYKHFDLTQEEIDLIEKIIK